MGESKLLKAFIEYCRNQGYGSAYDQESLIEHFLRVYYESITLHGVPIEWDNDSQPECQFCFRNRPTPCTLTCADGKVKPICRICCDMLDKWIAEQYAESLSNT